MLSDYIINSALNCYKFLNSFSAATKVRSIATIIFSSSASIAVRAVASTGSSLKIESLSAVDDVGTSC